LCELESPKLRATPAQIGDSDAVKVGDRVYAIGAPRGFDETFSDGLISGRRDWGDGRGELIQTNAAISHGSSGGGLFDSNGRLVGITIGGFTDSQNLNFAIPSKWILALDKRLSPESSTSAER
jgi:S1-C subfamily serine protease